MKRRLLKVLTAAPVARTFHPLMARRAVVFMLHRFRNPETGQDGHDPGQLRHALAYLRRERYELIGVGDLLRRLREGTALGRCVTFTLDDGHRDQVTVAGPVFAEFDCPATVFVTTGFVDGGFWFWWDQVEHVFTESRRPRIEVTVMGTARAYTLSDPVARHAATRDFAERVKAVGQVERQRHVQELASAGGVEIPQDAPARYAPMTWDDLRVWEGRGMSFAPHTVSHPILSQATDAEAREEILGSWARLRAEATRPVPVFSYPNGLKGDFGKREIDHMAEAGLDGAVTGIPGFPTAAEARAATDRFHVPRFGYPDDFTTFVQYVCGLERLKQVLRRSS